MPTFKHRNVDYVCLTSGLPPRWESHTPGPDRVGEQSSFSSLLGLLRLGKLAKVSGAS